MERFWTTWVPGWHIQVLAPPLSLGCIMKSDKWQRHITTSAQVKTSLSKGWKSFTRTLMHIQICWGGVFKRRMVRLWNKLLWDVPDTLSWVMFKDDLERFWGKWPSERHPFSLQGVWNRWYLWVLSNPNCSVITEENMEAIDK